MRWPVVLRKLTRFVSRNPTSFFLASIIVLCVVYPLRYPAGTYNLTPEREIIKDIELCRHVRRNASALCLLSIHDLPYSFPVNYHAVQNTMQNLPVKLGINPGGQWTPSHCTPWQKVAVILPYRDREEQLNIFLQHMHPFLQAQSLDYTIFVIEQNEGRDFNRGQLLNIGFVEALKQSDFCCFIFHDVDLLPQNPRNLYACSRQPRHMCAAIDVFRYKLLYPELFGGVVAFTKSQFELVNGYSNVYYGWGAEDDDLYIRVKEKGMSVRRWDLGISQYVMLIHKKSRPNPLRNALLSSAVERINKDGLNSLEYEVLKLELKPLYTHILVDLKDDI